MHRFCEQTFVHSLPKQAIVQIKGLVYLGGHKRRLFSHPNSPSSQTLSKIRVRGQCLSIQSSPVRLGIGPEDFYEVYQCSAFPSQAEWNLHPELSGRLACFSPVAGYTGKPQMSASRTSEASRTDDQCAEEQASPHADYHILRNGFGLAIDESASLSSEYSL